MSSLPLQHTSLVKIMKVPEGTSLCLAQHVIVSNDVPLSFDADRGIVCAELPFNTGMLHGVQMAVSTACGRPLEIEGGMKLINKGGVMLFSTDGGTTAYITPAICAQIRKNLKLQILRQTQAVQEEEFPSDPDAYMTRVATEFESLIERLLQSSGGKQWINLNEAGNLHLGFRIKGLSTRDLKTCSDDIRVSVTCSMRCVLLRDDPTGTDQIIM